MTTIEMMISKQVLTNVKNMIEMPHIPTLISVDDFLSKENIHLMEFEGGKFKTTDKIVEADKVGYFCYIAEDYFSPIYNKSQEKEWKLTDPEIDTKILRYLYQNLDFNAYSFDPIGLGFNIDGMTRISGRLYKIKEEKGWHV